jgi:SH2 domain
MYLTRRPYVENLGTHLKEAVSVFFIPFQKDWWYARNFMCEEGWIPSNYVAPLPPICKERWVWFFRGFLHYDISPRHPISSWYYGNLTHLQAKEILKHPKNITGTFLVRKMKGHLALSILYQETVKTYRISTHDGFFVDQSSKKFRYVKFTIQQNWKQNVFLAICKIW